MQAQFLQQGNKLTASGAADTSAQGASVALSADGNTLLVGAPAENQGAGAVWVYVRSGGAWVQQAKLVGSGVSKDIAGQGSSVALSADGNTALVGGKDDNGGTGAMWIFVRSNGTWTQQGSKQWGTVLLGIAHEGISGALSADGNTAIIGGDLDANRTGAAWVFTRTNGAWGLIPDKLVGFGSVGESHQGVSVGLSAEGTTAIVGAPGDNGGVGAAFVYTKSNGTWTQQGLKLTGAGARANAGVGTSVALSADGNTAMVGGSGDSGNAGAVWVFARSNNQWSPQGGKLTGSEAVASRMLGASVALSGDGNTALVGGPGGIPNLFGRMPSVGAAWVFTRSGQVWGQQSKQVGTGTANNDALQGTAVALSADGGTAAIGGPADNGGIGAAWIFGRPLTAPPVILIQPATQTITSGQAALFSVTAIGAGPLSYQWYQGARGDISTPVGLNSSTLTTPVLAASTNFWVRVSNAYGSADSNAVTAIVPVPGPLISRVTNAASHVAAIAPNTWVEIDGTILSATTRPWAAADFVNDQMPTRLDGVSVTVNGKSAYIAYISPTQLNILTPPDSIAGNVTVQVTNGGLAGSVFTVPAQAETPSFFVFGPGPHVAAEHANGAYLGPATLYPGVTTPAKPGETVVLFGTGFGVTTPPVVTGSAVQSGTLATPPVIQIGGIPATVLFAGLVAPGEFQFNVVVPPNAPAGDNTVTAQHNGVMTQGGVLLRVEP